jgi:hypothetical protein
MCSKNILFCAASSIETIARNQKRQRAQLGPGPIPLDSGAVRPHRRPAKPVLRSIMTHNASQISSPNLLNKKGSEEPFRQSFGLVAGAGFEPATFGL